MKKRFLILLATIVLVLGLGTTFVIFNIEQAISSLDDLVSRYEKDRKCTRILIAIKKVQQDGILHHTYGEIGIDEMEERIDELGEMATACTGCHHRPEVAKRVNQFAGQALAFQGIMAEVFDRAHDPKHEVMDFKAFSMGQELFNQAHELFRRSAQQLADETKEARSLAVKSKWLLYIITCSGLVVVIATAFLLIRSFTRPVQRLVAATQHLKRGDLDHRVHGLKDEFAELAESFNAMSASLQTQMIQLQRSEQLAACGKIATTLVHEVRNPLAGIKAAMEVLSSESSIAQEDKDVLLQVVREVNRVEELFSSMLEFARPKPAKFTDVNLHDVIERALLFTPAIQGKTVEVNWDKERKVPIIKADPNHLHQVFLNLFLNACAVMEKGGTLSITLEENISSETVAITIADTGGGIAEDVLADIFTPFFTTKAKGSGLGLATCKTLIGLHHGIITAGNRPEGGGAVFQISLPIACGEHHGE